MCVLPYCCLSTLSHYSAKSVKRQHTNSRSKFNVFRRRVATQRLGCSKRRTEPNCISAACGKSKEKCKKTDNTAQNSGPEPYTVSINPTPQTLNPQDEKNKCMCTYRSRFIGTYIYIYMVLATMYLSLSCLSCLRHIGQGG